MGENFPHMVGNLERFKVLDEKNFQIKSNQNQNHLFCDFDFLLYEQMLMSTVVIHSTVPHI